jgi:hypothetical protein
MNLGSSDNLKVPVHGRRPIRYLMAGASRHQVTTR